MDTTSVALATVLQNTAPYFVLIFTYFLFKEKVSKRANLAIIVGSFGCVMMSINAITGSTFDPLGILFSIASAFCLGMFYVGSNISLNKGYDAATFLFYMMVIAAIVSVPFADVPKVVSSMSDSSVLVNSLVLGIAMTLVPYYISAWAVKYLGALTVSVISVTEVLFAAIVGAIYFDESISVYDVIGILLVMVSVVMISIGSTRDNTENQEDQGTA